MRKKKEIVCQSEKKLKIITKSEKEKEKEKVKKTKKKSIIIPVLT